MLKHSSLNTTVCYIKDRSKLSCQLEKPYFWECRDTCSAGIAIQPDVTIPSFLLFLPPECVWREVWVCLVLPSNIVCLPHTPYPCDCCYFPLVNRGSSLRPGALSSRHLSSLELKNTVLISLLHFSHGDLPSTEVTPGFLFIRVMRDSLFEEI